MFLMKNKLGIFITACLTLVLSSCLKSDEITEMELMKNCQITSFSLSHDSIPGLDTVKFTIDQLTGRIFNIDSLPYGTKVEKVICKIKTPAMGGIEASPSAYHDSTYYLSSLSDSINFSAPVKFVVHTYDQLTTKVYMAQVNIHQVQPDSMAWSKYADPMLNVNIKEQKVIALEYEGSASYFMYVKSAEANKPYQLYYATAATPKDWRALSLSGLPTDSLLLAQITQYNKVLYVPALSGALYKSADGMAWEKVEKAPFVKSLLGCISQGMRQASALATVIEKDGNLLFSAMNESGEWTEGQVLPKEFPIKGYGNVQYDVMYQEYLMIAGGRTTDGQVVNTTWSTVDGLSWVLMASGNSNFSSREGAMLTSYDDQFFLIGGMDASNKAQKDIYRSKDHGITWALVDTMMFLPNDFEARAFSSIAVDKENYVNLFGGKSSANANDLNQLWRGRINRLIPKE